MGSFLLTSCDKVEIEEGVANVTFENPRYEGGSFFVDAYITNGLEEDLYVSYMDLAFYPQGVEDMIAGASFLIDRTIKQNDYYSIELEFQSVYVFVTEEEFQNAQYDLDSIHLFFKLYE